MVTVDSAGKCTLYALPYGIPVHRLASKGIRQATYLPNRSDTIALANHRVVFFKSAHTNELVMGRISTLGEFNQVTVHCDGTRTVVNTVDGKGRAAVFDGNTGRRLLAYR